MDILIARHRRFHPGDPAAVEMQGLLERQGFARCEVAERVDALTGSLRRYDVIVLFCVTQRLSRREEANLCRFVANGGGLVALHGAADCNPENAAFLDMLGAEFVDHDPHVPPWTVNISDREHSLVHDLEDFEITDEFYQIRLRDPGARPFLTFHRHGADLPLAFTRAHGKGRVFYMALGHGVPAYRNASFQRLFLRGVKYVTGDYPERMEALGVGFAGFRTGGIAEHHLKLMSRVAGLAPVAVCDVRAPCREHAERTHGLRTYARHARMLEDDGVRVVVVALPHRDHCREALRAIEAGRHVIVEKPMALTRKQADAMIKAAENRGVNLTCFQCRRWDHHYLAAQRLVRDYENIGDVFEVRLDLGGYQPPPATWRSDKRISGGLLYDMGAHGIDWVLNLVDKPVVGVAGYALHRMWRMVSNETHGRVVLRFRDGEIATFCESQMHAGRQPESLKILGTEGSITFPNLFDEEMQWTRVVEGRQCHAQVPCPGDEWAWAEFYRQFADHLHLGLPQAVTPQSAARVVAVLETAYRSARLGRELRFEDTWYGQRL